MCRFPPFYVIKACQSVNRCWALSYTPPDTSDWSFMHRLVICKTAYNHKFHEILVTFEVYMIF